MYSPELRCFVTFITYTFVCIGENKRLLGAFGNARVLEHPSRVLRGKEPMSTNETPPNESIERDERDVRALEQYLTVLPNVGRADGVDGLYLVVSESGKEYLVDGVDGACECPDHEHRGIRCKHIRRVAIATGAEPIPADVLEEVTVDEQLGEHVDGGPQVVASDGGIIHAGDEGEVLEEGPGYTYHREPEHVGGERFVRCEGCGREVVPADPDRIPHADGCPNARDE